MHKRFDRTGAVDPWFGSSAKDTPVHPAVFSTALRKNKYLLDALHKAAECVLWDAKEGRTR